MVLTSGLIEHADLRAFERSLSPSERPATPDDLSHALIDAGKLTTFQAAEIRAGRGLGLVLGNYVLLDRIGAGGMGQVFKAWHRRMHRTVALKTLPDQGSAGEDSIARFRREILSAAQLSHANIVAAYDADVAQKVHFLVMEYVEGPNLADLVRQRGPLPVAEAVRYVLDAARGLAYAHQRGVVHRDVKPSNLIVDPSGVVKVLDLGLARTAAATVGAELTLPGDVVGTLEYMAPEQAAGAKNVDRRADVYGLGCTLYRLLTGEFPYRGGSASALIAAHRDEEIPSLRASRADLPRSLDIVFKRMVAKQPSERFQSMDEVIGALEKLRLSDRRSPATMGLSSGRETSSRRSSPSNDDGSGDDLKLISKVSEAVLFQPVESNSQVVALLPQQNASADAAAGASVPPVSPLVALVALVATLAAITALSWFDSKPDAASAHATRQQEMGELGSAGEWAQQWAESLGVPVSMTNSLGMCFVLIPPGGDKENPSSTHVGAPYYYGVHELTTAQFQQFMVAVGYRVGNGSAAGPLSPGGLAQSDRHPVVGLTAADAEAFCHWLSQHEGASYRLPTQAEWAHACRAGAAARVWFGDEKAEWGRYAWYESNSGGRTHQVGLLEANPFGLHDLVGNAAEWCVSGDWRSGRPPIASHYVLCGGCWSSPAAALNAVVSNQNPAVTTTGGLRLVLELPLEARWPRRSAASRRRSTR